MGAFTEETFCSYPPFLVSQFLYRIFIFVSDRIKLDRAYSSDVYSILRNKSWGIFVTVYAIHVKCWSSYWYTPLILPRSLCNNYVHAQTLSTRRSFSYPSPCLGTRLTIFHVYLSSSDAHCLYTNSNRLSQLKDPSQCQQTIREFVSITLWVNSTLWFRLSTDLSQRDTTSPCM